MIKERRTNKWVTMIQTNHGSVRNENYIQDTKSKIIVDKDVWREIDLIIHEGMEFHSYLQYSLSRNGKIEVLTGRTIFIDYMDEEFRIVDKKNTIHFVSFSSLVDVKRV